MIDLIKINFQIIWKRGRFLNYLLLLSVLASVSSFILFYSKNLSDFGNNYDALYFTTYRLNAIPVFFLLLLPLFVTYPEGDIGIIERKIYTSNDEKLMETDIEAYQKDKGIYKISQYGGETGKLLVQYPLTRNLQMVL